MQPLFLRNWPSSHRSGSPRAADELHRELEHQFPRLRTESDKPCVLPCLWACFVYRSNHSIMLFFEEQTIRIFLPRYSDAGLHGLGCFDIRWAEAAIYMPPCFLKKLSIASTALDKPTRLRSCPSHSRVSKSRFGNRPNDTPRGGIGLMKIPRR